MKQKYFILVFVAIAMMLSACENSYKSSLVGEWEFISGEMDGETLLPSDFYSNYAMTLEVADDYEISIFVNGDEVPYISVDIIGNGEIEYREFEVEELVYYINNDTLLLWVREESTSGMVVGGSSYYFVNADESSSSSSVIGEWTYLYRMTGAEIVTAEEDGKENSSVVISDSVLYRYNNGELVGKVDLDITDSTLYSISEETDVTSISYEIVKGDLVFSPFITTINGQTDKTLDKAIFSKM